MPEASTSVRRRGRKASDQAGKAREDVQDTVQDEAPTDEAEDTAQDAAGGAKESADDGKTTITGELTDAVREAAIEVLKPVLSSATKSAAKYAVTQGPSLVKDRVGPMLEEAGGAGGLVKGVAEKSGGVTGMVGGLAGNLMPGGKKKKEGDSPSGTGRGRRLPVEEFIDVGEDLETVYDQFTQFEEWPKFMHRVERIEQRDDTTLMWHENIWGVRRSWEAEITDQTPNKRIAWRSKSGPQSVGVVTFHRLSDNLTRIYVTMDFQPKGLFEKTASGMRMSRRALKSDLMRFKAFVELQDEATGAWRGTIEEGEVVDEGEEGAEGREDEDAEARGEEEEPEADEEEGEEPEAEEDEEEPTASEDDEEYVEEDEEEEEEEAPRSRSRSRSRSGRFQRDSESEEEEEPTASEDEDEEEEEAPPAPRRRRPARAASGSRRRSTASSRGSR